MKYLLICFLVFVLGVIQGGWAKEEIAGTDKGDVAEDLLKNKNHGKIRWIPPFHEPLRQVPGRSSG